MRKLLSAGFIGALGVFPGTAMAAPVTVETVFLDDQLIEGEEVRVSGTPPAINDAGEIVFAGATASGFDQALIRATPGAASFVVREGDSAPGTAGARFSSFQSPTINAAGDVAFFGGLTGGDTSGVSNNRGVFATQGAPIRLVSRAGDQEAGGVIVSFNTSRLSIADDGDITFLGDIDNANFATVFGEDNGNLGVVLQRGDPFPTTPQNIAGVGAPAANANGEIAVRAAFLGPAFNNSVLLTGAPGALTERLDTTAVAPGFGAGARFFGFEPQSLSNDGTVSFRGRVVGPGGFDDGLFVNDGTDTSLIARFGDIAPGTGDEIVNVLSSSIADEGLIAFVTQLQGPGATTADGRGLYAGTVDDFSLIFRDGDMIDIGGGDIREILSFQIAAESLSDTGFLGVFAQFAGLNGGPQMSGILRISLGDGSVVIDPDPNPIPLPAAFPLFLMGLGGVVGASRRRRS